MVLSGMNSMEQLKENIHLASEAEAGMFGEQEHQVIKEVVEVFNKLYKVPCTDYGYCLPCPKKIDIPSYEIAVSKPHKAEYWLCGVCDFQAVTNVPTF